jgi:tetratricopeptide (TPR) repeat protein
VLAISPPANVAVFAGAPEADQLTTEALVLGQALDVNPSQLGGLLVTRALYLGSTGRRAEAIAYMHESVRLATLAGDNFRLGQALVNVSDALARTDPAAAAEAARTAAGHFRQVGNRSGLAIAIMNLAEALLQLGDWDAVAAQLTSAVDSAGLTDIELLACSRGWLAALRGDAGTAEAQLAGLRDLRISEDAMDKTLVSLVEAFTAAARRQPQEALRHARTVLAYAGALGISYESQRWAWPLAARSAFELHDTAATAELLTLLDSSQPGYLPPMLRAERDLARARQAAHDGDAGATAAFTSAIAGLRELSTPYHLAGGLLDHAGHLTGLGDAAAAALVIEAREIGTRLRCQPLLDRAAGLTAERTLA